MLKSVEIKYPMWIKRHDRSIRGMNGEHTQYHLGHDLKIMNSVEEWRGMFHYEIGEVSNNEFL